LKRTALSGRLSRRELEIAGRYADGEGFRQIADQLHLAPSTVRTHLQRIYRKLEVSSKIELGRALRADAGETLPGGPGQVAVDTTLHHQRLTLLYVFLDGFTDFARSAEPERLAGMVAALTDAVVAVVEPLEGRLIRRAGSSLVAGFGLRRAKETDAESAALAAMALLDCLPMRLAAIGLPPLDPRLALLSGDALLPAGGAGADPDAFVGTLIDIAGELARSAEAGRIVACARTAALARTAIVRPTGSNSADAIHELIAVGAGPTRFDLRRRRGMARLVGRQSEISVLLELLERSAEGVGQMALISGEAGIGKSRLVSEFLARLGDRGARALVVQCEPFDRSRPFAPLLRALLHRVASEGAAPVDAGDGLRRLWRATDFDPTELALALAELRGQALTDWGPWTRTSAERRRAVAMAALDTLVRGRANGTVAILVIEDLHWADPTTLEWIERLQQQVETAPVCILATQRAGGGMRSDLGEHVTRIVLKPLTAVQVVELIGAHAGGRDLSAESVDGIAARAEGVPLYVEELARAALDGAGRSAIPRSLEAALAARLDIPPEAHALAAAAAVVGRDFGVAELAVVLGEERSGLERALVPLVQAGIVTPVLGAAGGYYRFRHILLRDAAYARLTDERRRELHGRMAAALASDPEASQQVQAQHLEAAGRLEAALACWLAAAGDAVGRAANREVIDICERIIDLARDIAEPAARLSIELAARVLLGVALQATEAYVGDRLHANYRMAHELCERAGARPELFAVLRGLYVYNLLTGQLRRAHRLAIQLNDLAERTGESGHLVEARFALGQVMIYHGKDIRHGLDLLTDGAERYVVAEHAGHAHSFGQDPGVFCLGLALFPLVALGEFEAARAVSRRALALAERIGHPMSRAAALVFGGWAAFMMADRERAGLYAQTAMAVSREQLLPAFGAWGDMLTCIIERNLAGFERGLAFYDQSGVRFSGMMLVPMMAEAALDAGDPAMARRLMVRASQWLQSPEEEPCFAIEALRIAGRIAHAAGDATGRDRAFARSLAHAEATGARFFALRAVTDAALAGARGADWPALLRGGLGLLGPALPTPDRLRAERALAGAQAR
jgi:DNA-binding CsgD family transcriptional regulator